MKTSVFLISIGIVLLIISFMLKAEQVAQRKKIEGNKDELALVGGVVGGAAGAAAGASIGGIGVAACGTGIGIPVGLVMIGIGALGALCGSSVGDAIGTSDRYVTEVSPMFSAWIWGSLMIIAFIMIAWGCIGLYQYYNKKQLIDRN